MNQTTPNWHFPRPALARSYLDLFALGLTSARGLFARRRMGKTEFLKKDFAPLAHQAGYEVVYVNFWNLEVEPAVALVTEFHRAMEKKGLKKLLSRLVMPVQKVKASGKLPGVVEGSVEADLSAGNSATGHILTEAMEVFDRSKLKMIFLLDEAQVLAAPQNTAFAHALRAALDVRKDTIKVMFAGSSEATLRKMFGVASEPFYNWAPLEPFALLGNEFVEAMVEKVNQITKFPLSITDALNAFERLKRTPEFFRRYIENYLQHPQQGAENALQFTIDKVFNDEGFARQWQNLLPADREVLSLIAQGIRDLHSAAAMQTLGENLGIGDSVDKNTIHNALRRLSSNSVITRLQHGVYQFEDDTFADWVRHRE